jgi:hypothetical protein
MKRVSTALLFSQAIAFADVPGFKQILQKTGHAVRNPHVLISTALVPEPGFYTTALVFGTLIGAFVLINRYRKVRSSQN